MDTWIVTNKIWLIDFRYYFCFHFELCVCFFGLVCEGVLHVGFIPVVDFLYNIFFEDF